MVAALLFSMSAGLVGFGPIALAQTASTHDLAKTAPDNSFLYADLSLDTKSDQWIKATSIINAISGSSTIKSAASTAAGDGIEGGEAALIITSLTALSSAANQVNGAAGGSSSANGATAGPSSGGLTSIIGSVVKGSLPSGTPSAEGQQAAAQGIALVVKPKDMTKAWSKLNDSFMSNAKAASVTPKQSTYKGVKISSYAGSNGGTGAAIAQVDDNIVWAETPADVQSIVDVVKGDHKSLASVANFTKGAGALTSDHFAFGFLNGQALARGINRSAASSGSSALSSIESVTGTMTDAINTLVGAGHDTAFQISATSTGLGIQTVELPNGGSAVPAAAAGKASALTGATKVPADSLVFINGYNLGKSAVMQALGLAVVSIFSGIGGMATPVATPTTADLYQATAGFLGFNLQKDFLDQLTGKYVFALWANGMASTPSLSSINGVLASDAANPGAVQISVGGLGFLIQAVGQGKASVSTVSFGSDALSEVKAGSGSSATTIDFGVASKQFVLGIGDGAKTYLTGAKSSLADSANFKAAFTGLPAEYDGMAYVNVASLSQMSGGAMTGATPVAGASAGVSNVKSYAMVSYKKGGLAYTSSMLLVTTK